MFRGITAFIDGRVLPYDRQFVLGYFKATVPGGGSKLDELTEKYKLTWALVRPYSPAASPIGHSVMAMAEHREPCDSRGSCTVLGAPGGETPPGDSSIATDRHTPDALGMSAMAPIATQSVRRRGSCDVPTADIG